MIDINGKRILVGWAPHEILWLQAALDESHTRADRREALEDIADMTGRSYAQCQFMARKIAAVNEAAAAEKAREARTVPPGPHPIIVQRVTLPPSQINTGAAFLARRSGSRA